MVHGQEGVHRYGVGNIKRALRDALDKHDCRLPPRPTGTTSDVGSMKLLSAMACLDKELPDTAMLGEGSLHGKAHASSCKQRPKRWESGHMDQTARCTAAGRARPMECPVERAIGEYGGR